VADTIQDLARQASQRNSSAQASLRYLSSSHSTSSNQAALQHYTTLLRFAFDQLVLWGLSGHELSLKAFKALSRELPSGEYTVALSRSNLQQMRDQVEEVPRQVNKTLSELKQSRDAYQRQIRSLGNPSGPERIALLDAQARVRDCDALIKQLGERLRLWSTTASKLNLRSPKPHA